MSRPVSLNNKKRVPSSDLVDTNTLCAVVSMRIVNVIKGFEKTEKQKTFERKIPREVYRSCEEGRIEGKGMKLDATVTVSHSARCKRSIMLSSRIESWNNV